MHDKVTPLGLTRWVRVVALGLLLKYVTEGKNEQQKKKKKHSLEEGLGQLGGLCANLLRTGLGGKDVWKPGQDAACSKGTHRIQESGPRDARQDSMCPPGMDPSGPGWTSKPHHCLSPAAHISPASFPLRPLELPTSQFTSSNI